MKSNLSRKDPLNAEQRKNHQNGLMIVDLLIRTLVWDAPESGETFHYIPDYATSLLGREAKGFDAWLGVKVHDVSVCERTGEKFNVTLSGASVYDALYLARAVYEVLYDSIPIAAQVPVRDQMSCFMVMKDWPPEHFIKYAKYFTAAPMAKYLKNDLPKKPEGYGDSLFLFTGAIKRALKARMVSYNDKCTTLWAGYSQGVKRGAAPARVGDVMAALEKHSSTLSTPPPSSPEKDFHIIQSSHYYDIIFSNFAVRRPVLYEATTGASYESSRAKGGARAYLRRQSVYPIRQTPVTQSLADLLTSDIQESFSLLTPKLQDQFFERKPTSFKRSAPVLFPYYVLNDQLGLDKTRLEEDLTPLQVKLVEDELARRRAGKIGFHKMSELEQQFIIKKVVSLDGKLWRLDQDFRNMFDVGMGDLELLRMGETRPGSVYSFTGLPEYRFNDLVATALTAATDVEIIPLLEPLKIRLISKGNSERYYVSRFYQKSLWGHLQKLPQFVLTGRVVGIVDFQDLLDRERKLGITSFKKWVSGDYSAATDNLDIDYTKAAFEASLRKATELGTDVIQILQSVLYEQMIHYEQTTGDVIMQKTGQLMGSTLSFPILCIVNLVCYWIALEKFLKRSVGLTELPVLVNGDDILFRSSDEFYEVWKGSVSKVGFTLSLGKNYVHKSILTVNSQFYRHAVVEGVDVFTKIGYLNAGLLTGQSKVTGRDVVQRMPIWAIHNTVIEGAADPIRAHNRFLHYYMDDIKDFCSVAEKTTANLFLPFQRGGLGFDVPLGYEFKITSFQRKFATFLEEESLASLSRAEDPSAALGLVVRKVRSGIKNFARTPAKEHHPFALEFRNSYDVLNSQETIYSTPLGTPLVLAAGADTQEAEQVARKPSFLKMKHFRKSSCRRMGTKEIMSFGQVVVEIFPNRVNFV